VAILATGNELAHPGESLGPAQIIASNSVALGAFVRACGGEPVDLGIARDNATALERAIDGAAGCDLLVTTGGASVGEHDLVQSVLTRKGMSLDFWKIAMRPGKPLMFGQMAGMNVLGLPGNPVSALVTSTLFLRPAMGRMLGMAPGPLETRRAHLGRDLNANDFRQDYLRASLKEKDGRLIAQPFPVQDSSMLLLIAKADCLVVRPPHAPAIKAGEEVDIVPLSGGQYSI
jgi:molybdopterin molybdotransferase